MSLRLENIVKHYGKVAAVGGVSLTLEPGETLALLGPSGCGKSTLLRTIAGLETADEGRIFLNERDITRLSPQRRGFGMVFQDYALFPHLNVERNIAYGLVEKGWEKPARRERVAELLALVGLEGYEKRRVQNLSGGEQQRVALARALAPKPPLLLLDEPLSNLDLALRELLKEELRRILSGLSISAVYVTHDQSEAFALADRIAVMKRGRLQGVAEPKTLYAQPANAWVARFLGHSNLYPQGALPFATPDAPTILVRSDLIRLGTGTLEATVLSCTRSGALHHLTLRVGNISLAWSGFSREVPEDLEPGSRVRLEIPPAAVVGLAAEE